MKKSNRNYENYSAYQNAVCTDKSSCAPPPCSPSCSFNCKNEHVELSLSSDCKCDNLNLTLHKKPPKH